MDQYVSSSVFCIYIELELSREGDILIFDWWKPKQKFYKFLLLRFEVILIILHMFSRHGHCLLHFTFVCSLWFLFMLLLLRCVEMLRLLQILCLHLFYSWLVECGLHLVVHDSLIFIYDCITLLSLRWMHVTVFSSVVLQLTARCWASQRQDHECWSAERSCVEVRQKTECVSKSKADN